ncbi:SAM-dependent methyltransferase, partial [Streptomyces sp. DT225]
MNADAPGPATLDTTAELRKRIDTTKAHPARVYDVFLGGKDNYPADREAAALAAKANPRGHLDVRHNRDFIRRAVTALAGATGIRQFLDIGTGLPTRQNVHQIAQGIAPDARIVYVDNDPIVLVHAQALLTSSPEGRTDYIEADLRDPARILEAARRTLDFDRPVGLVLAAILH